MTRLMALTRALVSFGEPDSFMYQADPEQAAPKPADPQT